MQRLIQMILDLIRRLFGRQPEVLPEPAPIPVVEDEEPTEPSEPVVEDVGSEVVAEEGVMPRPELAKGAKGDDVTELQELLNRNGESLTTDGDFGPGTDKAVRALQESYGIESDGVVGASTWEVLDRPWFGQDVSYHGVPLPPTTEVSGSTPVAKAWNTYGNLLAMLGGTLGISSSAACAVLAVESAGEGFWNGRMVIRFETHIFNRYWGRSNQAAFWSHFSQNPDKGWLEQKWRPDTGAWRELHTKAAGQDEEWAVLEFARGLNEMAALRSISMGAPQIMGFNYRKIGFESPRAMFDAFSVDERAHVLGLFDFIRSDHRMVWGLRTGDWEAFARIYNGPGQAETYGTMIGNNATAAKELGI